jgi:hypothetical protein
MSTKNCSAMAFAVVTIESCMHWLLQWLDRQRSWIIYHFRNKWQRCSTPQYAGLSWHCLWISTDTDGQYTIGRVDNRAEQAPEQTAE